MQLFDNQQHIMMLVLAIALSLITVHVAKLMFSSEPLRGSPRYTWYHGVVMQIGVLQYFAIVAWFQKPAYVSTEEWLFTPWSDSLEKGFDRKLEVHWFCVFIAYMVKDCFAPMELEFLIHHGVSIALSLFFLMDINTPAIFMLGSCTMEIGSSSQTLFYLFPKSKFVKTLHFLGMTLSNSASYWLIYMFLDNSKGLSMFSSVLLTVAVGGLATGRQLLCFKNVGLIGDGFSGDGEQKKGA
jgi:hypothetical protein